MEGIERLETEVIEMNDYSITNIFEYLKTRTDLYDKFNNKEKTIKEMYDYIYDKASKKRTSRHMAMIPDKIVYLWAVTYFIKSNKELGIEVKETSIDKGKKNINKNEKAINEAEKNDNQVSLFEEVQG